MNRREREPECDGPSQQNTSIHLSIVSYPRTHVKRVVDSHIAMSVAPWPFCARGRQASRPRGAPQRADGQEQHEDVEDGVRARRGHAGARRGGPAQSPEFSPRRRHAPSVDRGAVGRGAGARGAGRGCGRWPRMTATTTTTRPAPERRSARRRHLEGQTLGQDPEVTHARSIRPDHAVAGRREHMTDHRERRGAIREPRGRTDEDMHLALRHAPEAKRTVGLSRRLQRDDASTVNSSIRLPRTGSLVTTQPPPSTADRRIVGLSRSGIATTPISLTARSTLPSSGHASRRHCAPSRR